MSRHCCDARAAAPVWASLLLCAACAPAVAPAPEYPERTTLALAGPRCADGRSCACRPLDSSDDQDEQGIPAGMKRFEFRLPRTTSALWVEIKGKGVYFKDPGRVAPRCFYVDLAPGTTRVVFHSERRDPEVGLQTGLVINEYGPKEGPHWYKTFQFACGGLNTCTKKGLRAWVAFMRQLPRDLFNPCGSTRIKAVSATGTRATRKDVVYRDVTARFSLEVYAFETYKDPASAECRHARQR